MTTYHIEPDTDLAHDAVTAVREFPADTMIAVRGQDFDDREIVFMITDMHHVDWDYICAGDWLERYEQYDSERYE